MVLVRGMQTIEYSWQWHRIWRYFGRFTEDGFVAGPLIDGMLVTAQLSAWSLLLAALVGFVLSCARRAKLRSLRLISHGYTEFIRSTPQLVQLYILYFLLSATMDVSGFWMGVISLGLFEAAFAAEIYRAGIKSVPQGQAEAARSLGVHWITTQRLIFLPQMLPIILPAMANMLVNLIKHSAIVTVIAVPDLTNVARNLIADTFLSFELWLAIALIYASVCYTGTVLIRRWEKSARARISYV